MTLRHNSRSTWFGRLLRGRRIDRNPLRRRSDRAETVFLGVLLAAFAIGAPLAAHTAGSWTRAASARAAQVQRTLIHQVPATLLEAAPAWDPKGIGAYPEVDARWTAPDGKACTGLVTYPGGGSKGSTVMIWVTRDGKISDPPLQPTQILGRVVLAEVGAGIAVGVTLLTVAWLVRWALDKRRMAAWDAEWLANGPRWSPRRLRLAAG